MTSAHRPSLSKDTTLCISLAARPSNLGTRFHNHLYDVLGLDFLYKAFTTTDLAAAIGGVRALGIRGCSVSMPFKETPLLAAARAAGRQVVTGTEVAALQAAEQFERYTGVRPTPEQVAEASRISRA